MIVNYEENEEMEEHGSSCNLHGDTISGNALLGHEIKIDGLSACFQE